MNPLHRRILLIATSLVVIIVGILQILHLFSDRTVLPPDDFVEYWAAGRLNAIGDNPYDPAKLLPLERSIGRETDVAIMMWNPPWTLAIAMPFGLLDGRAAQLIWLLLGFLFVGFGADWLWRIYDGPKEKRWIAWLLAFTFVPTFFVLGAGQIGTWVLFGIVLFLGSLHHAEHRTEFARNEGRTSTSCSTWLWLASVSTVLLAIKPHLVYLFWIALIVWAIRNNRKLLLGGLLAGLAATGIALACNPHVLQHYWEAMTQRPPAEWKSPTLGALLRMIEGEAHFGLQFVPTLLGLGWLAWYVGRRRDRTWQWREEMPLLLLVSFVTSSYGAWPFDLVILLPAVIQVAAALTRQPNQLLFGLSVLAWITINLIALVQNLIKVESFWFIWMAPALLVTYLLLKPSEDRS